MSKTAFNRRPVFVTISPTRLELAAASGDIFSRPVPAEVTETWDQQWPACLQNLAPLMAELVKQANAAGCTACVAYSAPGATVGAFACPAAAGHGAAHAAARLGLNGLGATDLDHSPHAVLLLHTDTGGDAQAHSVGAADTDLNVCAIATFLETAGLRAERLLPAAAIPLVEAASIAAEHNGQGVAAVLWIGPSESALAASSAGRLRLVRSLPVGIDALVEALSRPIRVRSADGTESTVNLSTDEARAMIERFGVPGADLVLDSKRGIKGSAVLPLIQPVLQRMAIEVKQSLRFGLDDRERESITLSIAGPGARPPNLAGSIGRLSGLTVATTTTGSVSLVDSMRTAPDCLPFFRSLAVEQSAMHSRMRRAVRAGFAAAAALIALDYLSVSGTLGREQQQVADLERRVAPLANPLPEQLAAEAARQKAAALEKLVDQRVGPWIDHGAVLAGLAEKTPARIRLSGVEMLSREAGRCNINGYIERATGSEAASVLKEYMAAISSLPVVNAVSLGPTQKVQRDGAEVQQFEITLTLVTVPSTTNPGVVTATAQGSER